MDASNQVAWQKSLAENLDRENFVQAGVRLQPGNGWSVAQLAPVEKSSGAEKYVRSFGEHSYPQSACSGSKTDLQKLMSHSGIVSYSRQWREETAAARNLKKPFFLSETNSATCGGGGISSTFGASLWIVDYVMQSILAGVNGLMFHQGTIGNSKAIFLFPFAPCPSPLKFQAVRLLRSRIPLIDLTPTPRLAKSEPMAIRPNPAPPSTPRKTAAKKRNTTNTHSHNLHFERKISFPLPAPTPLPLIPRKQAPTSPSLAPANKNKPQIQKKEPTTLLKPGH